MKTNRIVSSVTSMIIRYGAKILLLISIAVMTYLSFLSKLEPETDYRVITTMTLIAMVLNYLVWDSYYQSYYNAVMLKDLENKDYCIHRRYYNARRLWQYQDLQIQIREFNKNFVRAWISEVEDILGRKEEDIIAQPYYYEYTYEKKGKLKRKKKRYPNRFLIWRIKNKKYPESGIKSARDLLNILRVGKSNSVKLKINAAETYRRFGRAKKILISVLSTTLAVSLTYSFVEDPKDSLLKLLLNLALIFTSVFFGAISGTKGGQLKLSIAEEVSELLEEWKNKPASEEPYNRSEVVGNEAEETEEIEEVEEVIKEKDIVSIEIT